MPFILRQHMNKGIDSCLTSYSLVHIFPVILKMNTMSKATQETQRVSGIRYAGINASLGIITFWEISGKSSHKIKVHQ